MSTTYWLPCLSPLKFLSLPNIPIINDSDKVAFELVIQISWTRHSAFSSHFPNLPTS